MRDPDADGVARAIDNCQSLANPGQEDSDGDGVGDACGPPLDACDLVNREDVQEFVSDRIVAAEPGLEGDDLNEPGDRRSRCLYNRAGETRGFVIIVTLWGDADGLEFNRDNPPGLFGRDGEPHDLQGLGDSAWYVQRRYDPDPHSLYARKGQFLFLIETGGLPIGPIRALAERALERLK